MEIGSIEDKERMQLIKMFVFGVEGLKYEEIGNNK